MSVKYFRDGFEALKNISYKYTVFENRESETPHLQCRSICVCSKQINNFKIDEKLSPELIRV